MDTYSTAIILCAGLGSRMSYGKNINKCAIPIGETSAVRHTALALLEAGANNIVVVTGYAQKSVLEALSGIRSNISFAHNIHFDRHGCNYSLAYAISSEIIRSSSKIIIAEGDSILHPYSIQQIANVQASAASLIRPPEYIDYSRSVIAIGAKYINRYVYDQTHSGYPPTLSENENIMGDSMQLWAFSGSTLEKLYDLLRAYREVARCSTVPLADSGVHTINELKADIMPVVSDYPEYWINLNTQKDLRKARELEWLLR